MKITIAAAVLAGCLTGAVLTAQTAPAALLVLAKTDQMLVIVDPATLKVLGRVPSGPDPHEVAASTDGRTAYISNYNAGQNILTVVDLVAMKPLPNIDLGPLRAPHGLIFAAGKLWFTAEGSKVIGSYDPAATKVDWVLGTGQNRTHMIHVTEDARRIVTTNITSATVTIAEKTAGGGRGGSGGDWDATIVGVGKGAEGFDVSPDGREIWTANAEDGTVSIVDAATKRLTHTIAANVTGANRLKFTPDGKLALISTLRGPDLTIIDATTRREVKRLPIGRGAAGIQVQPDGLRAYVACSPDNYVTIVDLKSLEVAGRIDAGGRPDGLAWAVRR